MVVSIFIRLNLICPNRSLNVYERINGRAKKRYGRILQKYFIVRISWGFGVHGNDFVKTMLHLEKMRLVCLLFLGRVCAGDF